MENLLFKCTISNSSSVDDLGVEVWLDYNKFFDQQISKVPHYVSHSFSEDEAEHSLRFVLKNKTADHTVISESGEIIRDALIEISNITFDNINIDQLFYKHATYNHSFNNTGTTTQAKFYGNMGCNGTVELKFSTPFYMWLLEHM